MLGDKLDGTLRSTAGHLQDALGGLTGDLGMQGGGKVKQMTGSAQHAYGQAMEQARDAYDMAADAARDAYGELESQARRQPLLAVAVGLGLGLVLAMLLNSPPRQVVVKS